MRKLIVFMVLCMLVLTAACSEEEKQEAQDNESKDNTVKEKNETPESPVEKEIFPLTGAETEAPVNHRIVSVMVNNHRQARPQTGLSKADVVFEILAEGRITRLLALYQSELPDVIGPVRSAREYYFELANGYDALYVYHGAANFVNDMIKERGIEHLDGAVYDNNGQLFKRESFRKAPHNSYLQTEAVNDTAKEKGYEVEQTYDPLPFATDEEAADFSGDAAGKVGIDYSSGVSYTSYTVEYTYNENEETYARSSDGEKTVERNTGEQVTADNIFIVEAPHQVIDSAGRREIDLESGGNAYLVQKGKVRKIKWENRDGRIVPVKDGKLLKFVQGNTWINVVPSSPGISESVTISN
ncbi:Protein of unknown function [Lentibacillus persicus]|uniref:Lipoprotein YerB n=1 Tax=Lentibacillus persicus TaxID=640948 RepID=A0A1I1Z6K2_9BACI|nr:DUF3048 domain-containing protein [Lentibacillus persicus]SFE26093.1 Protein of unknown function [Lentibacillus persicus]